MFRVKTFTTEVKIFHTREELCISLKTVLGHRVKIMEKLDIHNRTELIKYAMRKGLVSIDA